MPFLTRRIFIASLGTWSVTGLISASSQTDSLTAERQRQKALPHATDPIWQKLKACKVEFDATHNGYRLTPTAEVKAINGKTIVVQGFTLPLDGSDRTHHFLIGVNTPVCFYHPPVNRMS